MQAVVRVYSRGLALAVMALAGLAGAGIGVMVLVTCADVVLRKCGHPLSGSYDLVRLASAVVLACGLPYTTAVKGHVSIEYFLHKFSRGGRLAVGVVVRVLTIAVFGLLAWRCVVYGEYLRRSGQVSDTVQIPLFWLPHLIALSCAVTALVILHGIAHADRELIKP
jgi:TRAP-type C4-dicarboxylate transport system permease small subunit